MGKYGNQLMAEQGLISVIQFNNAVPQNLMNFNNMIMYSDGFMLDLDGHIDVMGGLSTWNLDVMGNSYLNGDVVTGGLNVSGILSQGGLGIVDQINVVQTNVDANSLDIANLQGADATLQTNIDNAVP
ncbi:MAG TPA: hypothetical protein EYN28_05390, partial [Flavobacteriales bacterium]|nr:hypothetical protein [Flavobacteriales bacterium]